MNFDASRSSDGSSWLSRPLACGNEIVLDGLDPGRLTGADLETICDRMWVILDTLEMPRCEGRWIPLEIFNDLEELEDQVYKGNVNLSEWSGLIARFGEYYQLTGSGPIPVTKEFYQARFGPPSR